jgi:hypothetical protein
MRRGLSLHSIEKNCLGFHPVKTFQRRSDWGLEETENQKWICLPAGILIPIYDNGMICKIKIRKSEWKPGDLYGKYYEIPGSCNLLPLFGDSTREICLLVESELDAMLVVQEAGDLCNCIALGGAQKRPHLSLREWICARRLILFALDFDESGNKEYPYWQESFSNLEPWPVPDEKSPGDYFVKGGNLRDWILAGMKAISRGD